MYSNWRPANPRLSSHISDAFFLPSGIFGVQFPGGEISLSLCYQMLITWLLFLHETEIDFTQPWRREGENHRQVGLCGNNSPERSGSFSSLVLEITQDQLGTRCMEFASDVIEIWLNLKMAYQLEMKKPYVSIPRKCHFPSFAPFQSDAISALDSHSLEIYLHRNFICNCRQKFGLFIDGSCLLEFCL